MTHDAEAAAEVDPWGIQTHWIDAHDEPQVVPEGILQSLREIISERPDDLDEVAPIVTRPGHDPGLGRVEVECELGGVRRIDGVLPEDFPLGYHTVRAADGNRRGLIVSPGRCWLPQGWRAWGWTVQLYAARSRRSWGIGDLRDLKTLREWSQTIGAGFLLVNPLHAVAPVQPQEDSPYLPVTRRFRNPIYLCVDDVAAEADVDVAELSQQGLALNDDPVIDRDAVWTLKREALSRVFAARGDGDGFDTWVDEQGSSLHDFAVWCALAEDNGPDWREWQQPLQDPRSGAVSRFAADHAQAVAFHTWLQWQLDRQLREASSGITVLQDLPIGVGGGGADAWAWQELLARDVAIGAPPDLFNTAGQDWGSPPLIPWRLRESGYRHSWRRSAPPWATVAGYGSTT